MRLLSAGGRLPLRAVGPAGSRDTMIVSHERKFIFLKTNKTAGTSMEIALSEFCGDEDIITRISPADEQTRSGLGFRGPQNYTVPASEYSLAERASLFVRRRNRNFYNHIPAKRARRLVGERVWNEYHKFCVVRNPWDRVVSQYYWRCQSEPRPPVSKYLRSRVLRSLRKRSWGIYTIDGEVAVDRACLYENLEEELEDVRQSLGLPEKLKLPRAKGSHRKDRRHYRDILSGRDRRKIERAFAREIDLFGYEW